MTQTKDEQENSKRQYTTTTPFISVIMPVYNGEAFVVAALQSIFAQNYSPLEVIVIDDGSTDTTAQLVQTLIPPAGVTLRYFYQPNKGQASAMNYALRLAQGEVIGFLDADDLWPPDRILPQLAHFSGSPETLIILGRFQSFVDSANVNPHEIDRINQRPYHYSLGSSLFKRQAFDLIGDFDQTMLFSYDWDWHIRAQDAGIPTIIEPQISLLRRIHRNNMTRQREQGSQAIFQMLRKTRARRKQTQTADEKQSS